MAHATFEALVRRMPKVALVFDPLGVSTNYIAAVEAGLGVQTIITFHAVRVSIASYVQHTPQVQVAFIATEVLAVPVTFLSLGVFTTKDQLPNIKRKILGMLFTKTERLCHTTVLHTGI